MAKKLGNDYRLWIESSTPGTFNMLKGQTTLQVNSKGGTIDTTSKDDFPWSTQAPGSKDGSIAVECIPDLPDANGYSRLETLSNAASATAFRAQIRKGGATATGSDVVVDVPVYITDFPIDFGMNGAVKANFTLIFNSAPTVYTLA